MKYIPIDYAAWILGNEAREGANLRRLNLLNEEELQIWNGSLPYQDQRNDPGHGEMTAYFALKLLDYLPGDRKIAVPAAMLHDTGWYGNDPAAWKRLVDKNKDNLQALESEANRRPHQNRGILIASRLLEKAGYFERNPMSYGLEIADIIGDHDTRKLPPSDNGKIVRAADLLWRVTYPHLMIYMENEGLENISERIGESVFSAEIIHHLGAVGERIARIEFANTLSFRFPK